MHDPRIDLLAKQLVRYSTQVQKGEKVLLDCYDTPPAVALALIRAVVAAKAIPVVKLHDATVTRELMKHATPEGYEMLAKNNLDLMKEMDAYIAVRGSHNITEMSDVPAAKMQLVMDKLRPVINERVNHTKWCVLRWPTAAMAQQAGMSSEAFEDFFFRVCLLDYKALLPAMNALKKYMDAASKVHIKGPGTDLTFSLKGLKAIACGGTHNIPDGEVFSAPVKNSVEGVVSYNAPTVYQGMAFDNVRLEFKEGKIVNATSNNTKALNKVLDSDEGARYIGEFAIGFNREIREPMRDILFDEKIAGSFHFTPGQAYEGVADNGNRSSVHWDLVCIQRPDYGGGEIWFDDTLIRKNGKFLPKDLQKLN
ncbi:aminopeptidase [Phragmitibacter flavus]|uniref:Aminopeptidase n=1 Tax=Phragmitibacter flavus TaxID=2576071 RepID=A0A5R8KGM8_9BACT|nr:aminopeptidase [Phragmitibacter flavus]TLD71452.1 aminopeptidase [Phragmitibacter flavus]